MASFGTVTVSILEIPETVDLVSRLTHALEEELDRGNAPSLNVPAKLDLLARAHGVLVKLQDSKFLTKE